MTSQDEPPGYDAAHARVFSPAPLPEFVFHLSIARCAWLSFDVLCSSDGWSLLRGMAQQRQDPAVHVVGVDLETPQLLALEVDADPERYWTLCADELVAATHVRWWGASGRWGIHGSRDLEIAVVATSDELPWPRSPDCDVLSIDAALRLAQAARVSDEMRRRLLTTYDALSWDPASQDQHALPELIELCRDVEANRVDPVLAIRGLVDLLGRVPKHIRRIPATERLHAAWSRTHYLLLGEDRAKFGPLLLAQNDCNHERHSSEERALVRQAAHEILEAFDRPSGR